MSYAILRSVRLLLPTSLAALSFALLWLSLGGGHPRPLFAAPIVGETCFATPNNGATVYSSTTAQAVREAVAVAASGGIVKIAGYCPGVAAQGGTSQTVLITQTLTLAGGYTVTNWATAYPLTQPTTLDALGGGRVMSISVSATLQGFTVTNGAPAIGDGGGGVYAAAALTLTNMTVYSNTIQADEYAHYGGGAYILGAARVTNSVFKANQLDEGGGGGAWFGGPTSVTGATFTGNQIIGASYEGGGGALFLSTTTVINTTFTDNIAADSSFDYGNGGGAEFGATATLTDVVFTNNRASNTGGGAHFYAGATLLRATFTNNQAVYGSGGGGAWFGNSGGPTTIMDSTFTSNQALAGNGGGINGEYAEAATLSGTTFISNTAYNDGGGGIFYQAIMTGVTFISNTAGGSGGGAYIDHGTVTDTAFISNTSGARGGGVIWGAITAVNITFVDNVASSGGGAAFYSYPAHIIGVTFINNTARYVGGGATFNQFATWVTDTTFIGNRAGENGGGAYFRTDAPHQLANVLFARNHANGQGAAIYVERTPRLTLLHTTIVSPTLSPKAAVYVAGGTVYLTNTLIASHTVGIERVGGTVTEDYNLFSNVPMPYSGTVLSGGHSVFGPAAFYDTQSYTLTAQSWAIDRGTNAGVTTDYFGNLRPQGTGFDIGYAEAPYGWVEVRRYYLPLVRR